MSSSADKQPADGSPEDVPAAAPSDEKASPDDVQTVSGDVSRAPDGADPEAPAAAEVAASAGDLERALAEAQRTIEEQRESVLRVRAEMDNLRKRTAREVENARRYGTESLVEELLPVVDSIERGLELVGDGETAQMREGLELVQRMLLQAVAKFGLRPVDPAGDAFDPEYHQAISVREAQGVAAGTVVEVVQKGYQLHDRLVRAAMVIVAK